MTYFFYSKFGVELEIGEAEHICSFQNVTFNYFMERFLRIVYFKYIG